MLPVGVQAHELALLPLVPAQLPCIASRKAVEQAGKALALVRTEVERFPVLGSSSPQWCPGDTGPPLVRTHPPPALAPRSDISSSRAFARDHRFLDERPNGVRLSGNPRSAYGGVQRVVGRG